MLVNKSNQALQSPDFDESEIDQLSEHQSQASQIPSSTQKTIDLLEIHPLSSLDLIDFLPQELRQKPFARPLNSDLLNHVDDSRNLSPQLDSSYNHFNRNSLQQQPPIERKITPVSTQIKETLACLIEHQKNPKECVNILKERFPMDLRVDKIVQKAFQNHFISRLKNTVQPSHKKWNDQEIKRMHELAQQGYNDKTIALILSSEFEMRFSKAMVEYRMTKEASSKSPVHQSPLNKLINRCIKSLMTPEECLDQVKMHYNPLEAEEIVTNEFSKHYAELKKEIIEKPVHNDWTEEELAYLFYLKEQGYSDKLASILLTHRFDLFFTRESVTHQLKITSSDS